MHVKHIDIYVYWASQPHTRHMDVNPVPMHVEHTSVSDKPINSGRVPNDRCKAESSGYGYSWCSLA